MNIKTNNHTQSSTEERGIFGNITFAISQIANLIGASSNAAVTTMNAVDKGATVIDVLAGTTVKLALANDEIVSVKNKGELHDELSALYVKYPYLKPKDFGKQPETSEETKIPSIQS